MQLLEKTWPQVEAYLKEQNILIVPIGSTEQHGPTGLIGTDAMCAESISKGVGEKLSFLVGPTINVGMAQHHLAFPGSVSLRPTTLIAYINDYVHSLAKGGFRRFFFINGHGGNTASLKAAFSEISAEFSFGKENSDIHLQAHNWYEPGPVVKLRKEMFEVGEGSHAT
ncbi:MAG: creatininase family protein, partial [Rhodospirillales bacterium]|nr:creatininase family protein [Rhodospirillales bacterium]